MLEDLNYKKAKYNDILKRLHKNNSIFECLIIYKKLYLTNNLLYYYLCIIFRFIHILSFSGDYYNSIKRKQNTNSFQKFLKKITLKNLFEQINISFKVYIIIDLIILFFVIIEVIIIFFYVNQISKKDYDNNWPLPNKFQIIYDHISFLFFPYIIEYLSFGFYIFFFSEKFMINIYSNKDRIICLIFSIINTFLIIIYNIFNYIGIICSNKIFTITIFDANLKTKETDKIKYIRPISYRISATGFYFLIFIQNILVFLTIENYIKNNFYKIIIKTIFSIALLLSILIYFLNKVNQFNYLNHINCFINLY